MQYDPIKRSLGRVFNATPVLRILFYKMLDLLLLRAWHIKKTLKRVFKNRKNEAITVLDAGSGFGQYSYFLSKLGKNWNITGVDIKLEQMEDCNNFFQKIGKGESVHFQLEDLTLFRQPESFDLIISVDVMEHIEADEAVFSNFYESLKPGGMLLISTPSDKGGSETHDHHQDEASGFIDEHVRDGYNREDIIAKLKRAGFTNISAKYTYGKPGHIAWLFSMKYPIIMLNASKLLFVVLPFYYLITFPFCLILNYWDVIKTHPEGTGLNVEAFK